MQCTVREYLPWNACSPLQCEEIHIPEQRLLCVLLEVWNSSQGCQEDCGGPGQIQKVGPILCDGESGGMPPENVEILHALKCVLGASEVPICACIQYIPTCQLPSLLNGFRLKSMKYGALASSCAGS